MCCAKYCATAPARLSPHQAHPACLLAHPKQPGFRGFSGDTNPASPKPYITKPCTANPTHVLPTPRACAARRGMKAALGGASGFCSDTDFLILEDDGGRMSLRGACLPVHELVTGVVMAVKGMPEPGGDFQVNDVCYLGLPPQVPLPVPVSGHDKYVALVSGLGLGRPSADLLKVCCTGRLRGGRGAGEWAVASPLSHTWPHAHSHLIRPHTRPVLSLTLQSGITLAQSSHSPACLAYPPLMHSLPAAPFDARYNWLWTSCQATWAAPMSSSWHRRWCVSSWQVRGSCSRAGGAASRIYQP